MPPKDRVSRLVYNQPLSALEKHLVMPSAPNSHYKNKDIIESLVLSFIDRGKIRRIGTRRSGDYKTRKYTFYRHTALQAAEEEAR
jgi:hypothetical protein